MTPGPPKENSPLTRDESNDPTTGQFAPGKNVSRHTVLIVRLKAFNSQPSQGLVCLLIKKKERLKDSTTNKPT